MFCLTAIFDSAKKKQKISHINLYFIIKSITILMEMKLTKNKDKKDNTRNGRRYGRGWDYYIFALTN